jgi:hypothetical protein
MAEVNYAIKRSSPRFQFSTEAEAILPNGSAVEAQVFQLSLHGCYIDSIESIPVGTRLELHISNGMSVLDLSAKVLYADSCPAMGVYGMGLAFENVPAEQNVAIEARLQQLAAEQQEKSAYEHAQK